MLQSVSGPSDQVVGVGELGMEGEGMRVNGAAAKGHCGGGKSNNNNIACFGGYIYWQMTSYHPCMQGNPCLWHEARLTTAIGQLHWFLNLLSFFWQLCMCTNMVACA